MKLLVATALALSVASAPAWSWDGRRGHYEPHYHRGPGAGVIIGGLAATGVLACAVAGCFSGPTYAAPPAYYGPPPVYYGPPEHTYCPPGYWCQPRLDPPW